MTGTTTTTTTILKKSIAEYNTLTNYTLIDGLTPTIIKRKYIWLLNAIVKNAIIGEDDYGLVWYSGTWIAGEWEDGTWYSGVWKDGEWKNGKFYSYYFDRRQLLMRNKVILEKNNPMYSEFRKGIWRRGEFFNGYFGTNTFYEDWDFLSKIEIIYNDIRWEDGVFYNGVFRNSSWLNGIFQGGVFYNSEWINGTFKSGTFQGNRWWNGLFTGGDFILGSWLDGEFNQSNNIKSRFGSMPATGTTLAGRSTTWYGGTFLNGEFHSGLNIVSGMTQTSDNHNRTWSMGGTWLNGIWYGGTHADGDFNNGFWLEGCWSGGTFNNGYWSNGFWLDGVVNDGFFESGLFVDVTFNGGQLGFEPSTYLLESIMASRSGLTIPPRVLNIRPTVITDLVSDVTSIGAVISGNVVANGGEIVTSRGICWSRYQYPTIDKSDYILNGYGVGQFVCYIYGLEPATKYYARAFATNVVGTDYGNRILVTTLP